MLMPRYLCNVTLRRVKPTGVISDDDHVPLRIPSLKHEARR